VGGSPAGLGLAVALALVELAGQGVEHGRAELPGGLAWGLVDVGADGHRVARVGWAALNGSSPSRRMASRL
jgi:hypothetical protein